jgi:FkbM family methyltransferase
MSNLDSDYAQKLQEEFFGDNIREDIEIKYLPHLLKNCNAFIDVGANIGQYTFFSNKSLNNSTIFSIEANKELLPILEKNCQKWEKESNNSINTINAIVSNKAGVEQFYVSDNRTGSSIFDTGTPTKSFNIKSIELDEFYEHGQISLIKIDIEGAEYRALMGADRYIKSENTKFFIELHGWGDKELKKYPLHIANMFFANGYCINRIGCHYLFERGSLINRIVSYSKNFPLLFSKYFYRRYVPFTAPVVTSLARIYLKIFNKKST